MDIWEVIATERRRLADELEQLSSEQWNGQTQCEGWDVRHLVAHIVMGFEMSAGQILGAAVKSGFNMNKMVDRTADDLASRMTPEQLTQSLRENADNRQTPPLPGMGAEIPLSEVVVHGQDIRRPLGLESTVPEETIEFTLSHIKNDNHREDYRARCGA